MGEKVVCLASRPSGMSRVRPSDAEARQTCAGEGIRICRKFFALVNAAASKTIPKSK